MAVPQPTTTAAAGSTPGNQGWWCCPDFTTLPCTDPHCDLTLIGSYSSSTTSQSHPQQHFHPAQAHSHAHSHDQAQNGWSSTTGRWTGENCSAEGEGRVVCCEDRSCAPGDTLIPSTSAEQDPAIGSGQVMRRAGADKDCACCAAGCPPGPADGSGGSVARGEGMADCPECATIGEDQPANAVGVRGAGTTDARGAQDWRGGEDTGAGRNDGGQGSREGQEDVVLDEATIQELLKCCCCGDETSPSSFQTHHLTTHPTHDLGPALPSFLFPPTPTPPSNPPLNPHPARSSSALPPSPPAPATASQHFVDPTSHSRTSSWHSSATNQAQGQASLPRAPNHQGYHQYPQTANEASPPFAVGSPNLSVPQTSVAQSYAGPSQTSHYPASRAPTYDQQPQPQPQPQPQYHSQPQPSFQQQLPSLQKQQQLAHPQQGQQTAHHPAQPRPTPAPAQQDPLANGAVAAPPQLFPCKWAGCQGYFPTHEALTAHVNAAHLHSQPLPEPHGAQPTPQPPQAPQPAPPTLHPTSLPQQRAQFARTATATSPPPTKRAAFETMMHWKHMDDVTPGTAFPAMSTWILNTNAGPKAHQQPTGSASGAGGAGSEGSSGMSRSPSRTSPPQEDGSSVEAAPSGRVTGKRPLAEREAADGEGAAGEQEKHVCRWQSCGAAFATTADLTVHLSEQHVGSGKSNYVCLWDGCCALPAPVDEGAEEGEGAEGDGNGKAKKRRRTNVGKAGKTGGTGGKAGEGPNAEAEGEGGEGSKRRQFAQRQKIMRHLQAHTGDRPFACDTCGKAFGEMTTLVQHQRTHTNEKPFACDFQGCNKAFALASALTIHRRTHSGAKPFVCPYDGCGAAFAESSNLTKHVRVHTGERPFVCKEEGCGRAFKRSDQLARHRKVHE